MIIGLSGYIGSGKDTVGKMLRDSMGYFAAREDMGAGTKWYSTSNEWDIKKFAEKLKQIASLLTGIPREKFEDQDFKLTTLGEEWTITRRNEDGEKVTGPMTVREFLQKLGSEGIRDGLHKNAWVNALFADYKEGNSWIITDVRFPNEAQAIKDRGGYVVRIKRFQKHENSEALHQSETGLDKWVFDYVLPNYGSLVDLEHETGLLKEHLRYKERAKTLAPSRES